jgi:hypothetical protein
MLFIEQNIAAYIVLPKNLTPGPNPTASIYIASVVKNYNATNSLARF